MPYRVELSKTGRATCKAGQSCKVQIGKDELRLGSWVEISGRGNWSWKHWGCCTSRVIGNVIKSLTSDDKPRDPHALDGYDELPEAEQAKVRRALEQGHIDDEDWRHEEGGNRQAEKKSPGAKKGKGKKKNEDEEDDEDHKEGPADVPKEKKKIEKKETAKKPSAKKIPEVTEQADKPQEGKAGKIEYAPNDYKAEDAGTVEEPLKAKKGRGAPKKEKSEEHSKTA
ncbi:hypothetical protein EV426DRAFT_131237 [Tirmania nivea]|nr:hypothetical protein EV426DRAFT_131237 [Tirmania nivea]